MNLIYSPFKAAKSYKLSNETQQLSYLKRNARLLTRELKSNTNQDSKGSNITTSIFKNFKSLKDPCEIISGEKILSKIYNSSNPYDISKKSDQELLSIAAYTSGTSIEPGDKSKYTNEEVLNKLQKATADGTLKIIPKKDMLEECRNAKAPYSEGIDFELIKSEIYNMLNNPMMLGLAKKTVRETGSTSFNSFLSDNPDLFFAHEALDNTSALHAFYVNRAESMYSGEELNSKKTEINSFFGEQTAEFGERIANILSQFGDSEGIKQSVTNIIQDRSLDYQRMLKDGFKTGVEGTKDDWAKDSGYFVASKMKQSITTSITNTPQSNSKYSAADIKAAITMQIEYSNQQIGFWTNGADESVGVNLGMIGIKNELLLNGSEITNNGKELLRNMFSRHVDDTIKKHDDNMDFLRDDKYSDKSYLYSRLNKNTVKNVITEMVDSLKSKNFEQTLRMVIQKSKESIDVKKEKQVEAFGKMEMRYAASAKKDFTSDRLSTTYKCYNLFVEFVGIGKSISENAGIDVTV